MSSGTEEAALAPENRLVGRVKEVPPECQDLPDRIAEDHRLDVAKSDSVLEGPLQVLPGLVAHAVGNIFGGASLGAGWVLGKANAKLGMSQQVSDSAAFKLGFKTWLYSNGVVPTVLCESGPYGNDWKPLPQDPQARKSLLRSTPIIVSNHVSYLDTVVLPLVLDVPKLMAMKEVSTWPLFGQLCQEMDMIWVDRSDSASRQDARKALEAHVATWQPGERPLLMWPEATTSNGMSMKEFKSGAFACGNSIRPVLIKYTGDWDPSNVDFREAIGETKSQAACADKVGYGDVEWAKQFFGHLIHSCMVLVCKPYHPSAAERADPHLYSANVRQLMLERLNELHATADRNRNKEKEPNLALNAGAVAIDGLSKGADRLLSLGRLGMKEAASLWTGADRRKQPHIE